MLEISGVGVECSGWLWYRILGLIRKFQPRGFAY